jgi:hypothetical protein
VPAEGVGPEAQPESNEVLLARAGDSGVVAVPPEAEEVRTQAKIALAKVRGHSMTHHPKDPSGDLCSKAKIQRRPARKVFRRDNDEHAPVDFEDPCTCDHLVKRDTADDDDGLPFDTNALVMSHLIPLKQCSTMLAPTIRSRSFIATALQS